jgi:uncharacterized protein DUF4333
MTGIRWTVAGTIAAALITAAASIIAALLNRGTPEPPATWLDAKRGEPGRTVFDEAALESNDGVQRVLIDNYGMRADQIERVDCPDDQEVAAGTGFSCVVELGGDEPREMTVDITVRDDSGEYEVGRPR